MITLLFVMQRASLCYYTIITYYYVIITSGLLLPIITYFNLPNLQMKTHLFSGVEGRIQSVTDAKGEGLGAGQRCVPTILNCRRMMAKHFCFACSFSSVAGS